jgi:hypothetical protein
MMVLRRFLPIALKRTSADCFHQSLAHTRRLTDSSDLLIPPLMLKAEDRTHAHT